MPKIIRVLLAEDNPGDVFLIEEALTQNGVPHSTTVASDGQKAWQLIESAEDPATGGFDFFILDFNLPLRSGVELATRIRSSTGEVARAPILIASSSNAPRDRQAAETAGANSYFCKPSNLEAFIALGGIVKELWSVHCRELPSGDSGHD